MVRTALRTTAQNARLALGSTFPRRRNETGYFSVSSFASRSALPLFWAHNPRRPNFGDELAPMILHATTGRHVRWSPLEAQTIVGGGSTLEWLLRDCDARRQRPTRLVWGAGFMYGNSFQAGALSDTQIVSLRGRLTQERVRDVVDPVPLLGDLGLLAGRCFEHKPSRPNTIPVLFIPHYVDEGSSFERDLLARWNDTVVMTTSEQPHTIMSAIAQSSVVVSSALHPLIVADSFGVPNVWIRLSDRVGGGDFKFKDYLSVFDLEPDPVYARTFFRQVDDRIAEYVRPSINRVVDDVHLSVQNVVSRYEQPGLVHE